MEAKKLQLKCWVSQYSSKYAPGGIEYMVTGYKPSGDDLIPICEQNFEFEIPASFNPVAAEVAVLQKKLDTLAVGYHEQRTAIQSRINDLLCLEAPKAGAQL